MTLAEPIDWHFDMYLSDVVIMENSLKNSVLGHTLGHSFFAKKKKRNHAISSYLIKGIEQQG